MFIHFRLFCFAFLAFQPLRLRISSSHFGNLKSEFLHGFLTPFIYVCLAVCALIFEFSFRPKCSSLFAYGIFIAHTVFLLRIRYFSEKKKKSVVNLKLFLYCIQFKNFDNMTIDTYFI